MLLLILAIFFLFIILSGISGNQVRDKALDFLRIDDMDLNQAYLDPDGFGTLIHRRLMEQETLLIFKIKRLVLKKDCRVPRGPTAEEIDATLDQTYVRWDIEKIQTRRSAKIDFTRLIPIRILSDTKYAIRVSNGVSRGIVLENIPKEIGDHLRMLLFSKTLFKPRNYL